MYDITKPKAGRLNQRQQRILVLNARMRMLARKYAPLYRAALIEGDKQAAKQMEQIRGQAIAILDELNALAQAEREAQNREAQNREAQNRGSPYERNPHHPALPGRAA